MRINVYQDQSQAIAAGENSSGTRELEIDVSTLTEAQRHMLSQKLWRSGSSLSMGKHPITPVGVIAVLDELLAETARAEQAENDRHERAVADLLAMSQDEINAETYWDHNKLQALDDPRLAERRAARKDYLAEQQRLIEVSQASHQAEYQRMLPIVRGMIEHGDYEGLNTANTGDAPVSRPDWYEWGYGGNQGSLSMLQGDAMREIKSQRAEAERSAWIETHGSERLRLVLAGGYKVTALYLHERVALELGADWIVDTADRAEAEERCAPTLEALRAVEVLPEGYIGEVVWLIAPPNKQSEDEEFAPCEAVQAHLPYSQHSAYLLIPSSDC